MRFEYQLCSISEQKNHQNRVLEASCWRLEPSGKRLEASWSRLGSSWLRLEASWKRLNASWSVLETLQEAPERETMNFQWFSDFLWG